MTPSRLRLQSGSTRFQLHHSWKRCSAWSGQIASFFNKTSDRSWLGGTVAQPHSSKASPMIKPIELAFVFICDSRLAPSSATPRTGRNVQPRCLRRVRCSTRLADVSCLVSILLCNCSSCFKVHGIVGEYKAAKFHHVDNNPEGLLTECRSQFFQDDRVGNINVRPFGCLIAKASRRLLGWTRRTTSGSWLRLRGLLW